jgi:glycerol-3-phosphate dehydrogenase
LIDKDGRELEIRTRALVNAAGPWVEENLARLAIPSTSNGQTVLVKGSHIVVPRLYDGAHAYILQHTDNRVIFVIPYEGDYSLIGTTDIPFDGDPGDVRISLDEIEYLCGAVNAYFDHQIAPDQVCWSFAGVRPLFGDGGDDPSAVTRDYVLELDNDGPPLLSIYGGKITTYRRLAEAAMARLRPSFPNMAPDWTATSPLPGGEAKAVDYPHMPAGLMGQLRARHGSCVGEVLGDAKTPADLGQDFGAGLTAREIDYMVANEWAVTAEDILWRRSKCGLHLDAAQQQAVADYLV